MRIRRAYILIALAVLTVFFLGSAAYTLWNWGNENAFASENSLKATRPMEETAVPEALRLTVRESGITAVSAQVLRNANFQFEEFSPANLNLTRNGQPVPFYVDDRGEEAHLYFYAQAVTDTLEAPAVYRLRPGQGVAIKQQEARPTGPGQPNVRYEYHWEESQNFLSQVEEGDMWLGPLIFAPDFWEFPLDEIQPSGGTAEITIRLWSSTEGTPDPDHHVIVMLNGRRVADEYWDGLKQKTISIPLPEGALKPDNSNELAIFVPGDTGTAGEAIYIDWIHVSYEGALQIGEEQARFYSDAANILAQGDTPLFIFDVTDEDAPVLLTGYRQRRGETVFWGGKENGRYVMLPPEQAIQPAVSSMPAWKTSLRQTSDGADYIAIVADEEGFVEAMQPLLTHRRQQGLRVTAVSLAQVYDEFGYGRRTPSAIRNFLNYAAGHWEPPAPRFVLLVGDASYDIYDHTRGKNKNLLSSYLVRTAHDGYVTSDNWFVQFEESEEVQAMAIGRFPAQTPGQLQAMVAKTIAYETGSGDEADWYYNALLVADDESGFDLAADAIAEILGAGNYQTYKLYVAQNEDIRHEIIGAINRGVGLINYVGHGRETVWGDEAVFGSGDVGMLTNQSRLPILTTFTCPNGAFSNPHVDSLAETLLWVEDGGIVAAIAPSGRAQTAHQLLFADYFYQFLLSDELETVGEVLLEARVAAGEQEPALKDTLHVFNLLGDPALSIQRPR